jgi:hypothetical protein
MSGAIFIGLIYQYYYGSGDTTLYFNQSKILYEAFLDSPIKWVQLILHLPTIYDGAYMDYTSRMVWYTAVNNYVVIATAGFINVFTFNTYLPTSIIFAVLSFSGIWAMFRAFASQYPHLVKHIALVILFIPSTIIWGSGIFKDTLCMFGIGWMIYGIFNLLIQRRIKAADLIITIISFYIVAIIKIYILIAFIPALSTWILLSYSARIKSGLLRFILKLGIAGLVILGFTFSTARFTSELGQYSLENIEKTANITRDYIYQTSGDEGSTYSIGELDFSPTGLLKSFPLAVNVSLFRPYLWEARKPIVFFNAIEAFFFLFLTLKIIVRIGIAKIWKSISSDPNIQFCLIFTLVFAFAVGLTSGNFGALSRYRIPCLPLYGMALVLIYYRYNNPEKKFISWD